MEIYSFCCRCFLRQCPLVVDRLEVDLVLDQWMETTHRDTNLVSKLILQILVWCPLES